ncbi:class I SAM-dependent methyltransferase [Streptomyces gilvosporeus]|uniref:class I SAM-dependent methyltransferase n=1 Tax=Streptomyces gilvosporeus TaxID=553510 RepID=UPI00131CD705|nr:class I SAM-dependent methyltransferase [Streptomyces gilvosporeus]
MSASRPAATTPDEAEDSYESVAGLYDLLAAAQGASAPPRISAFAELAQPGMRVADVGAGTGRVALAVGARQADVWCVEPSASMRSALLAKLAQHPQLWPHVTVRAGQAPGMALDGTFDYAYLAGSLQFLDAADRRATFAELSDRLAPGALLALDMVDDLPVTPDPDGAEATVADVVVGKSRYTLRAAVTAAAVGRADMRYRYVTECGNHRTVQTLRRTRYFHTFDEVHADLTATGFTVDTEHSGGWRDNTQPLVARRNR